MQQHSKTNLGAFAATCPDKVASVKLIKLFMVGKPIKDV